MKSKKKPDVKKLKTWKPLALDAYVQQTHELVTHSIKGVNTNATSCGVRSIPQPRTDFPYACVRFANQSVELDYIKNSTSPFAASVATEQITAALKPGQPEFIEVPAAEVEVIRASIAPLLLRPETNAPELVSPRAKQILFSDGNGGDISLTPLHSCGLSVRLHVLADSALNARAQQAIVSGAPSISCRFETVMIKVGGDKLQNAGRARLVGAMQKAYLFPVPHETVPTLRRAFAMYYKGVSLRPADVVVRDYGVWLLGERIKDGVLQRTLRGMNTERKIVQRMANDILARAKKGADLIAPLVESGELPGLISPTLPLFMRGAIDIGQRSDVWIKEFSDEVAAQIIGATTRDGQSLAGLSGNNASILSSYIKENL